MGALRIGTGTTGGGTVRISVKVAPGVHVSGRVGGRKRRQARKPMPAGLKLGIFAFVLVAAAIGAIEGPGKTATPASKTKTVTRAGYAGYSGWPLTVDSGTLSCTGFTVLFTAGGVTYAQFPTAGDGRVDIDSITAKDPRLPGLKMYVGELMAEGDALC